MFSWGQGWNAVLLKFYQQLAWLLPEARGYKMTWIWALEPLAAYQAVEKGFMLGERGLALLLACTGSRDRAVSGPTSKGGLSHRQQVYSQAQTGHKV